ncbi:F-type H+-transporting ATPase subunit b [Bartonella fuyuanensis]|uniref:ATP synthase subunit b n=1 Tax=Bartonella fuyuanensis TaxID=1460968 RepID=A0A840E1Z9_9HYPH|nr:F0F1 ATP synthase subunit B [Bartonella fuyuanensis]MBB4076997.1 F-type H+-transporting ATPase subunit b [Bartonella fuyuanensis]
MFFPSAYAQNTETSIAHIKKTAEQVNRVFPPFDFAHFSSHFFWLAVSFGLFYLFISRVIVPRIGGVIETRRDRIASDLDQAMRMKQEADTVVETYERKLTEARLKAHAIAQVAGEELKEKAELERKEIEESLEKKLANAEKQIAKIRDKAMQNVDSIAEELSLEIVKKLINVDISKETVRSVVKAADY